MVNFFGEGDVVLMRVVRIVLLKVERSNWSLDLYAPIPLALNLIIFINLQHFNPTKLIKKEVEHPDHAKSAEVRTTSEWECI